MENLRVGPAYVLIGDPTQAAGAGMNFIGKTRGDVTITANMNIATGRTDQTGSSPLSGSVYYTGIAPVVNVPIVDEDKEKLALYLPNSSVETAGGFDALGFGSGYKHIKDSEIMSLCILPVKNTADYPANLEEEPDAFWLPAVICNEFGNFTFSLPDAGDDALNPHEVAFAGMYRDADLGGAPIPESMRVMFKGIPTAGGLTWTLPSLASFA